MCIILHTLHKKLQCRTVMLTRHTSHMMKIYERSAWYKVGVPSVGVMPRPPWYGTVIPTQRRTDGSRRRQVVVPTTKSRLREHRVILAPVVARASLGRLQPRLMRQTPASNTTSMKEGATMTDAGLHTSVASVVNRRIFSRNARKSDAVARHAPPAPSLFIALRDIPGVARPSVKVSIQVVLMRI